MHGIENQNTPADPGFADPLGRTVNYLRLSVTDRCNLRCFYCFTGPEAPFIPHGDILRYEELLDLVSAARRTGIAKVRLTGGEPFARKDFLYFLSRLTQLHPDLDVRVTTNATLLADRVDALAGIGVRALNISLDSLDPDTFARVTGRPMLSRVLKTMDACLAAGIRVKVNAVALRGVNDNELGAFLGLARDRAVDVRFIEFMPMGGGTRWRREHYWPAAEILASASALADLTPVAPAGVTSGPARMYAINGSQGRLGIISPLSNHFCDSCNRLRITSDGRLRTCLFSDREYRLRPVLRRLGPEAALRVMRAACALKPLGHDLLERRTALAAAGRHMSAIGG